MITDCHQIPYARPITLSPVFNTNLIDFFECFVLFCPVSKQVQKWLIALLTHLNAYKNLICMYILYILCNSAIFMVEHRYTTHGVVNTKTILLQLMEQHIIYKVIFFMRSTTGDNNKINSWRVGFCTNLPFCLGVCVFFVFLCCRSRNASFSFYLLFVDVMKKKSVCSVSTDLRTWQVGSVSYETNKIDMLPQVVLALRSRHKKTFGWIR